MPDLPDDSTGEEEPGDDTDANDPNEPIVTPEPGGDDALYAVVTTVSGSLNLRRDALPGSPVLARIPKGTTIRIDEKLSAWSRTTYGGQTGYVMNTYLTFHQGQPEISAGTTAVVTTVSGSLNLRTEPSLNGGRDRPHSPVRHNQCAAARRQLVLRGLQRYHRLRHDQLPHL